MPKSLDELTKVLQDAAYVGIGLSVIAFQKAQVQRQALSKSVQATVEDVRANLGDSMKVLEERLRAVAER